MNRPSAKHRFGSMTSASSAVGWRRASGSRRPGPRRWRRICSGSTRRVPRIRHRHPAGLARPDRPEGNRPGCRGPGRVRARRDGGLRRPERAGPAGPGAGGRDRARRRRGTWAWAWSGSANLGPAGPRGAGRRRGWRSALTSPRSPGRARRSRWRCPAAGDLPAVFDSSADRHGAPGDGPGAGRRGPRAPGGARWCRRRLARAGGPGPSTESAGRFASGRPWPIGRARASARTRRAGAGAYGGGRR